MRRALLPKLIGYVTIDGDQNRTIANSSVRARASLTILGNAPLKDASISSTAVMTQLGGDTNESQYRSRASNDCPRLDVSRGDQGCGAEGKEACGNGLRNRGGKLQYQKLLRHLMDGDHVAIRVLIERLGRKEVGHMKSVVKASR